MGEGSVSVASSHTGRSPSAPLCHCPATVKPTGKAGTRAALPPRPQRRNPCDRQTVGSFRRRRPLGAGIARGERLPWTEPLATRVRASALSPGPPPRRPSPTEWPAPADPRRSPPAPRLTSSSPGSDGALSVAPRTSLCSFRRGVHTAPGPSRARSRRNKPRACRGPRSGLAVGRARLSADVSGSRRYAGAGLPTPGKDFDRSGYATVPVFGPLPPKIRCFGKSLPPSVRREWVTSRQCYQWVS